MGLLLNVTWCRVMGGDELSRKKSMAGLLTAGIDKEDAERMMGALLEVRKDRCEKEGMGDCCVVKIYGDKAYLKDGFMVYRYYNVPRAVLEEGENPNVPFFKKTVYPKKVIFESEG